MRYIIFILIAGIFFHCSNSKENTNKNLTTLLLATSFNTINFRLDSGSLTNVGCSGYVSSSSNLVSGGSKVKLKDARFYVYDVKFISANGTETPFNLISDNTNQNSYEDGTSLAQIDFTDQTGDCASGIFSSGTTASTYTKLVGSPVIGSFTGLKFTIGVPSSLNHQDSTSAKAPLNSTGMNWSWNSGYKFMKIELIHEGGSSNNAWHLGSSSCSNSICAYSNRTTISVSKSSGFNPSSDVVSLDLQAMMNGTNTTTSAISCHAGPQSTDTKCATIGSNLGLKTDGTPSNSQTVFSIK
jgi:uncharacterized repeat protein (TIGR04052 family)